MQPIDDVAEQLISHGYEAVARLRPRSAREIGASSWCIGCETVDREYVDFTQVKQYLGQLGATQVRLQAGWARCEAKADGVYDFAWLDECVNESVALGVRPWLQTSYGNPSYEGGGGIGLTQGIPTSDKALAAWDKWVRALAKRYGETVHAWEIWNEADHGDDPIGATVYGRFVLRTASIIRDVLPHARIYTLSMAGRSPQFVDEALSVLSSAGRSDLCTAALFHGYPHNPDCDFGEKLARFAEAVRRHAPHAELIQGECGAPAAQNPLMAMRQYPWSPRKQAAWNLRRMLAHHAHGYAMNLFQLADMHYRKDRGARFEGHNAKGLLETRSDGTVVGKRPAYYAAQHVFTMFDGRYAPGAHARLSFKGDSGGWAWSWSPAGQARPAIAAWWRTDDAPEITTPAMQTAVVDLPQFNSPVLVDLLSGMAFDGPIDAKRLPCTDVPLALAERDLLPLQDLNGSGQ